MQTGILMAYESGTEPNSAPDNKAQPPPPLTGLVSQYIEYTKDLPSPYIFRLWTALHAVGAAAERRIWTNLGVNKLHANLFVFLVGPPGVGKTQAIEPMSGLLRKSQAVGMAPTDMTKQGLLDALAGCAKGAMIDGSPFDYSFMAICIRELSNFMSQYDAALAGLLTDLFDCPGVNEEQKRGLGKESAVINSPGISLLVGTATENLGNTISKDMWGSGFMARVIMVFSAQVIVPGDMFEHIHTNEGLAETIAANLRTLGELKGAMTWDPATQLALRTFRITQTEGAPIHNRLAHYVTRRWLHLGKLCMISALSDLRMDVRETDFLRAANWLRMAEAEMPEIFKDMVSHEDGQIYEELRQQMHLLHMRTHEAVPIRWMYQFLSKRVSSHAVERMIQVAESGDFIRRLAGTEGNEAEYLPVMPTGTTPRGIV